jgi:NAD-dependent dihydropyrimidine dehydrogenase PreA subunit
MDRFETMQRLLDTRKFFKLVCGAGNEDAQEVKKLVVLYTLAGAKGMDVSANINVVEHAMQGIDLAFELAPKLGIKLETRPFITVSVGMPGDHHVRKAFIDLDTCITCNLCIPVCPTDAIPDELIVITEKCIGCGNCSAICPKDDIITYSNNTRELKELLPKCLEAGAEQIELHAAVADDTAIMDEWQIVCDANPNGHVSMCLDRLHLSNFTFEQRVKKAKDIAGDRLIIQSDGYPMSGGQDDFNTTLQAIATADVLNKKFNMTIDKKIKVLKYKKINEVNQLISGGTNSLTTVLADQCNVKFQGSSLGTFARKIVKDVITNDEFYNNLELIKQGYLIARNLVIVNVGEVNE